LFLALYFGAAFVMWRNLKTYTVPGTNQKIQALNLSFLIITTLLAIWAFISLNYISGCFLIS
jgi:hypothetical protein